MKIIDKMKFEQSAIYLQRFLADKRRVKYPAVGGGGHNHFSVKHHFQAGWDACLNEINRMRQRAGMSE